jgi:hypothetical protein
MVIIPVYSKHRIPWTTAKALPQALFIMVYRIFSYHLLQMKPKYQENKQELDGLAEVMQRLKEFGNG